MNHGVTYQLKKCKKWITVCHRLKKKKLFKCLANESLCDLAQKLIKSVVNESLGNMLTEKIKSYISSKWIIVQYICKKVNELPCDILFEKTSSKWTIVWHVGQK